MKVLIRADASATIGTGHVMRCAALGMRLMAYGVSVHFICIDLYDGLAAWLRERNFDLTVLSANDIDNWRTDLYATQKVASKIGRVDLLIVDHCELDQLWESGMRTHARRIMVADDLADRNNDCDLLLDQNLHEDAQNRYKQRIPKDALPFLGPKYALLRTEFDKEGLERIRDGSVRRLLIFFGGTDPGNQTIKVIHALKALGSRAPQSDIVLGPSNPQHHHQMVHLGATFQ